MIGNRVSRRLLQSLDDPVTQSTTDPITRSSDGLRPVHLFRQWTRTAARLRAAKTIALFMDFDGTLAPLQVSPQRVRLPANTRHALARLAQHPEVHMWVVSGRLRSDVRGRVNVPRVECLGLHGWDGAGRPALSLKAFHALRTAKREIRARLRGLAGVWIEDKAPIFAVHYREASTAVAQRVAVAVGEVLAQPGLASELRLMNGLKVWEVVPHNFKGKGAAITTILSKLPEDTLPIYLGDDTTDETGFRALPNGLTVRVGTTIQRPTGARFCLRDPEEVTSFLEKMEAEIR